MTVDQLACVCIRREDHLWNCITIAMVRYLFILRTDWHDIFQYGKGKMSQSYTKRSTSVTFIPIIKPTLSSVKWTDQNLFPWTLDDHTWSVILQEVARNTSLNLGIWLIFMILVLSQGWRYFTTSCIRTIFKVCRVFCFFISPRKIYVAWSNISPLIMNLILHPCSIWSDISFVMQLKINKIITYYKSRIHIDLKKLSVNNFLLNI